MWSSLGFGRLKRARSLVFLSVYLFASTILGVGAQLGAALPDEDFLGGWGAIFPLVLSLLFTAICVSTPQIFWTRRKRFGFIALTWLGVTIVGVVLAELLVPLLDLFGLFVWRGLLGNSIAGSMFIAIAMGQSSAFAHNPAPSHQTEVDDRVRKSRDPYQFVLLMLAASFVVGLVIRQIRIGVH